MKRFSGILADRNLKAKSLLAQTRGLLRQSHLRIRKRLGQHFLVDETVLETVTSAAELTTDDIILEIGPGLGILTRELARQAGWVLAIELDNKLAAILEQNLTSFNNITIVNGDILKLDPVALLQEQKSNFPPALTNLSNYKVVANLPYYITSPVLRHFLEASGKPQTMVVMVQKEVAETIVARPGQMSVLSISVQLYGEPRIIDYVPARCFYPVPEVDSAILRIDLYPQPAVEVASESDFFGLVRAGFASPRKQLANSLAQGLGKSKAEVLPLLTAADIMPQRRAETLTLDEWAQLLHIFNEEKYADSSGPS